MPSDAAERWSELAAHFAIPEFLTGISTPAVAVGQLRQATWAHADAMVLIERIDDEAALAHVYPASVEPGVANSAAVIIEAADIEIATAVSIFPSHALWIPFASLDALLATLAPTLLHTARKAAATSPSSRAESINTRVEELFEAVDTLEEAPRLEPSTVASSDERIDIDLGVVMDTLSCTQSRAMDILFGTELISVSEADMLSEVSGIPSTVILTTVEPLPAELARELQEPRWRPRIRRRAIDGDEQASRLRLGYDAYQLAARQQGEGRDIWRQRLETLLAGEED